MKIYAMKRFWFKISLGTLTVAGLGMGTLFSPDQAGAFQEASTPAGIFATIIYPEPINVRSGPSTVHYPIIGKLSPGEVVPALGISPGHEWIEISYPGGVGSVGWIYASFASLSGGELHIVEPPPTPTPLITNTIDPTLAAAFNTAPTETRLPTFTPPASLEIPQFTAGNTVRSVGTAPGIFIMILFVIGAVGLVLSYVLRS
jgi:hypothetical protein